MTSPTRSLAHRATSKRGQPVLSACLALILVFCGCTGLQLSQFQQHAARGDHAWIAAQTIKCRKPSDSCGQLHLTKGDACFRLAKMGTEPAVNYACAADELDRRFIVDLVAGLMAESPPQVQAEIEVARALGLCLELDELLRQ